MVRQSSLGTPKIHKSPSYQLTKIGRVSGTKDYLKYGRIEVTFLDYGAPMPVWVVGDIDREPVENDMVVVGYMEGRKDAPYLVGFVRNKAYTSNFITSSKDRIRMQLPKFDIGVKKGDAVKDAEGSLLDETKLKQHRVYVEVTKDHAIMSFPYDKDYKIPPAQVELTKDGATLTYYYTATDFGQVKISKDKLAVTHPLAVEITTPKTVKLSGKDINVTASSSITLNAPTVTANGEDLTVDDIGNM